MTLDKSRKGQALKVISIANDIVRAQALRFGIAEGEIVVCEEILPAGPVVIRKNKQEIAIGRGLAQKIFVEPMGNLLIKQYS